MTAHNGWNSLGDVRALEVKVQKIRDIEDMAEWGRLTLKLIADMDYLNGCVKRGRGSDIDADTPARNIFEYIKEIETALSAERQRCAEIARKMRGTHGCTVAEEIAVAIMEGDKC